MGLGLYGNDLDDEQDVQAPQQVQSLPSRPMNSLLGHQVLSAGQPTHGGMGKSTLLKLLAGAAGVGLDAAFGEGEGTKAFSHNYVEKLQADQAAKRQEEFERDKERRAAAHEIFNKYSGLDLSGMPDFQKEIQGYGQSLIKGGKYDPTNLLAGVGTYGGRLSSMLDAQAAKRAGELETSKTQAQLNATNAADAARRDANGLLPEDRARIAAQNSIENNRFGHEQSLQGSRQLFDLSKFEKEAEERRAAQTMANEAAKNLALLHADLSGQLQNNQYANLAGSRVASMNMQPYAPQPFQLQPPPFAMNNSRASGVVSGASTSAGARSNSQVPAPAAKDPARLIKYQGQLVPFSALPPDIQAKVVELGG